MITPLATKIRGAFSIFRRHSNRKVRCFVSEPGLAGHPPFLVKDRACGREFRGAELHNCHCLHVPAYDDREPVLRGGGYDVSRINRYKLSKTSRGYAHEIFGFRTHKPEVNIVVVRDVEEMKGEKPYPQLKWRRTCMTLPSNSPLLQHWPFIRGHSVGANQLERDASAA